MLPKRLWVFLACLVLMTVLTLLGPIAERGALEANTLNSIPNASAYGYKGLYMLLQQIQKQPVQFWQHSIMKLPVNRPQTVWFIEPGHKLFFDGPAYSQKMRDLVRGGYHFIFVLDEPNKPIEREESDKKAMFSKFKTILDYLTLWFKVPLTTSEQELSSDENFAVTSQLPARQITILEYHRPQPQKIRGATQWELNSPFQSAHLAFIGKPLPPNATSLLNLVTGPVLAVQIPYGKGSITVIPNSRFFRNGELNYADNAALAAAIQEQFPQEPILFEGYSLGFDTNRDLLTYLASGKGFFFFITSGVLLIAFLFWLATRPAHFKTLLHTSDETVYTQETFIHALGQHYLETRDWDALYHKLLTHFQTDLSQRYPGLSPEDQRARLAQSPFVTVSLEALEAIFDNTPIRSEAVFVQRSQALLALHRKVQPNEFNQSNPRLAAATPIRR